MPEGFAWADGGVLAPAGFVAGAAAAGLKKGGKLDVAIVAAERPVPAAAVFTTNAFAAAPVVVSRRHIASGAARAIVINAGNANAATGERGLADAQHTAEIVARALEAEAEHIIISSTGVIGVPLPMERIEAGVRDASEVLDSRDGTSVAEAIMTTDTLVKQTAVSVELSGGRTAFVGGMAKGSGMIQPNMATMLAVLTTDAPLTSAACDRALKAAVRTTFNRISVDSDTSTNDMVVLLASGAAGGTPIEPDSADFDTIASAVATVSAELARMIVRDGEGATKLITVTVRGAASESDAEKAAFAVANSPLVKTAIFGEDANWGRVAMALGKSGAQVDPACVDIAFAGIITCSAGEAVAFDEAEAAAALAESEVSIECDLHLGEGEATVLTCDLSYEYVRINGDYRT